MTRINATRGRGPGRFAAVAALALLAAGCDSLVEYTERDVIPPDALAGAAGAQALYAGAVRDFGAAYAGDNGGTEGLVLIGGLMSDEYFHSGTFSTRVDYATRNTVLDNSTLLGTFRRIQTARLGAHRALDAMLASGATEANDARFGAMYNRIGIIFLLTAQTYCNGIPFSSVTGGVVNPGLQITTSQMLDSAVYYFDKALASNAGSGNTNHHLANLMKARALMNRGTSSFAAAAALVGGIPTNYRAMQEHSTANGINENGIYVFNVLSERWSLAHREGGNGLPFRGASADGTDPAQADPRVPWKRDPGDIGFDNVSPQYDVLIYTARDQASIVAKGEEARLIEAEALLQAGNTAGWLDKLNTLRAGVTGLAPLTDPGTAAGRVDLMFSERAFWLFATGNRLGDLRRLIRQYGRAANAVFPVGTDNKGNAYGNDVNFPVPDQEKQNPNYSNGISCLDRNA